MKPEIKVGGIYLCKDGRIRRVRQIKPQKRWPWEKRVNVEILYGRIGKTTKPKSWLSMITMTQYVEIEVPEKYHNQIDKFPSIHALKQTLKEIEKNDHNYDAREILIYRAIALAKEIGLKAGFRVDSRNPDGDGYFWPVATIDLPTGQCSWHMPGYEREWDGHDTPEKYRRIRAYVHETEDAHEQSPED